VAVLLPRPLHTLARIACPPGRRPNASQTRSPKPSGGLEGWALLPLSLCQRGYDNSIEQNLVRGLIKKDFSGGLQQKKSNPDETSNPDKRNLMEAKQDLMKKLVEACRKKSRTETRKTSERHSPATDKWQKSEKSVEHEFNKIRENKIVCWRHPEKKTLCKANVGRHCWRPPGKKNIVQRRMWAGI
jgi:hypothetical protein